MPGPTLRTDIVEVYVFRRPPGSARSRTTHGVEFLQLHRCKGAIANTWQPVMGHEEEGETAVQTALRELKEETGFAPGHGVLNLWQLEAVNTFFHATLDAVMLTPGFAVEVAPGMEPKIDDTHDGHRWVTRDQADRAFLWAGQRRAVVEIVEEILPPDSIVEPLLRLPF